METVENLQIAQMLILPCLLYNDGGLNQKVKICFGISFRRNMPRLPLDVLNSKESSYLLVTSYSIFPSQPCLYPYCHNISPITFPFLETAGMVFSLLPSPKEHAEACMILIYAIFFKQ